MSWGVISSQWVLSHSRRHLLPFVIRRWLLPHCRGRSLIPSFFAHLWQLQKIHCMGVSLVPAQAADAGSQNQLITRELLSSPPGFLSHSSTQGCNEICCFSFLISGQSWSLRLFQMSRCFELSLCLGVSVLLLLDWFQR